MKQLAYRINAQFEPDLSGKANFFRDLFAETGRRVLVSPDRLVLECQVVASIASDARSFNRAAFSHDSQMMRSSESDRVDSQLGNRAE